MSWADVWSVTRSKRTPRRCSSAKTSAAFPSRPTETPRPAAAWALHAGDGVVEVVRHLVEVARLEPALDPVRVDLDGEAGGPGEGGRKRLGAAHPAQPGGEDGVAGQVGRAPVNLPGGGEGLVGALEDPLGADVDPRTGRHLTEHRQPLGLQPPELVPVGEPGHEQRVRDQDARRARVRAEDAHRLAALDKQRLVRLELEQRGDDRPQRLVAAGGAAGAAVDHQPGRVLGHLGVEVVAQHPQGRLLVPALAVKLGAPRRAHRGQVADERLDQGVGGCGHAETLSGL